MSNYFLKIFYALLLLVSGSTLGFNIASTSAEAKFIERERQALLKFKQGLHDASGMLSTWRDDEDCCKWKGIECNNETGYIHKLVLRGHGTQYMRGAVNFTVLTELQNMEYLDLSYNDFRGSNIPKCIALFTKLRYLNLSDSLVGGSIPYQLANLSHLQYLDLGGTSLSGAIPLQIGNLRQLRYLDLRGNSFIGPLPFQIGNLPNLHTLRLSGNFVEDAEWLSTLYSLTNLELTSFGNLGSSHHWLQIIKNLIPNLLELRLVGCGLLHNDIVSMFHSHSNFSNSLTILDLSHNMLTSSTFRFLSNLNFNLQELYLSYNNIVLSSPFYINYPYLVILDLSYNNLASAKFQGNFNFSSKLQKLYLTNCSLMDSSFLVSPSSSVNSLSSLVLLDLSYNMLKSSNIFDWLFNFSNNLQSLYLYGNLLQGPIPNVFGKVMNSLEDLDLSHNKLQGEIPTFFGNMCTLQTLDLSSNNLSGQISSFIQNSSWCNRHIFQSLNLSYNRIIGALPEGIGLLSELEYLSLEGNSLEGDITESHLTGLSKLKYLYLSYNSLSLKFPSSWVPPFQLRKLGLASCKLGSSFPSWLKTQSYLWYLDISDAGLNDSIPKWFWKNSQYMERMNMSHNNLVGAIPNLPFMLPYRPSIFLDSNQLDGAIPPFLLQASQLMLSNNKFSDMFSFLCDTRATSTNLASLDLSNNQIKGQLPDCWKSVNTLLFLDLRNNNLSGKIPLSMGTLVNLESLVLRNNSLEGELPTTLKNCKNLMLLDVGENLLSGPIPSWIGENMQHLIILSMTGNRFSGNLPIHLCYLRNIQLLDLSRNNLSKGIPSCLKNFTAMSEKSINTSETRSLVYWYNTTYYEVYGSFLFGDYVFDIALIWKGMERWFKDPELNLKSIDLSSNHLTGEIPKEVGYLLGLVSLNLSKNNLSGEIPSEVGNLISLDFLDLSTNHLSGQIPSTLSKIDRLSVLDLSNNYLYGRIPLGRQLQTFDASSFEGNLNLCGEPLKKRCHENDTTVVVHGEEDNSDFFGTLYISLVLGYITGFVGLIGPILIWRPWRNAYLRFLNRFTDYIYVMVVVNVARYRRWLKGQQVHTSDSR